MIGIGVTTFNRVKGLRRTVRAIKQYTNIPYHLVVADDGSSDGTANWCEDQDLHVIRGVNKGVAWNKNRLLLTFSRMPEIDVIILLDDDCFPNQNDWAQFWSSSVSNCGHLNYRLPYQNIISGLGEVDDPYLISDFGGACIAVSRSAFNTVGFMDPRFKGYGLEHVDWTRRFVSAGYGGGGDFRDKNNRFYFSIDYGLEMNDYGTSASNINLEVNREVLKSSADLPIYRSPWITPEQQIALCKEVQHSYDNYSRYSKSPRFEKLMHSRFESYGKRAFEICTGNGLEFGALSSPFDLNASVTYVDKYSQIDLLKFYSTDTRKYTILNHQLNLELSSLSSISTGAYDFVISSHLIEMMPNFIDYISEWLRIVRVDGVVYFVTPHREFSSSVHDQFLTTFDSVVSTYQTNSVAPDLSYFNYIKFNFPDITDVDLSRRSNQLKSEGRPFIVNFLDASTIQKLLIHFSTILGFEIIVFDSEGGHLHCCIKKNVL